MVLVPSQWRLGQMTTVWTTSGSPSQPSELQVLAKPVPGRGKLSVALVLTRNNSDLVNQDSDLQQASTHFDYLHVNGHEILISDFALVLDIVTHAFANKPVKHFNPKLSRDLPAKLAQLFFMLKPSV